MAIRLDKAFGGGAGSLPVTEQAASEVVSLPMYAELSDAEVEQVLAAISEPAILHK